MLLEHVVAKHNLLNILLRPRVLKTSMSLSNIHHLDENQAYFDAALPFTIGESQQLKFDRYLICGRMVQKNNAR